MGVIAHPLRNRLMFAMRGLGTYIVELDKGLKIVGSPERVYMSQKTSFAGATIAVDSLYTTANEERKRMLLAALRRRAFLDKGVFSQDETGSNIAYQFEVARGKTLLGITDAIPADKGRWDWSIGRACIIEAKGAMVDPTTGLPPTSTAEVVIYGNPAIVALALPDAEFCYSLHRGVYQGFDTYDFEKWRTENNYASIRQRAFFARWDQDALNMVLNIMSRDIEYREKLLED